MNEWDRGGATTMPFDAEYFDKMSAMTAEELKKARDVEITAINHEMRVRKDFVDAKYADFIDRATKRESLLEDLNTSVNVLGFTGVYSYLLKNGYLLAKVDNGDCIKEAAKQAINSVYGRPKDENY